MNDMDDRNELINDYLLGELSDQERSDLERRIEQDPALAAEVAALAPIVSKLEALPDEAWAGAEPPPFALPGAGPSQVPSEEPDRESLLQRIFGGSIALRPAIAMGAALLLFVGGVGVGLLSAGDTAEVRDPSIQQATLTPVRSLDAGATGSADIKQDGQAIRLKLSGLAPNSDKDFYEAWLLNDKEGLVAIGTFRVGDDGSATLDLPVPVGTDSYPVVDISLQPADGKPTHSGVSVLRGTLES
jgi:anti-sigma-K factor RskA